MPPAPGSVGRPISQAPKVFDEAKLAAMSEPLTVKIDKLKGNTRMPITLPDHEDGSSGMTGWTSDDVRKIDNWLVTEWSGGGLYEVTVTDSSNPSLIMKWQPYWDVKDYPEKTPPTVASAHVTGGTQQRQPPQQPQPPIPLHGARMSTAWPNGLPQGLPSNNYPQPQPSHYGPQALGQQSMYHPAPMPPPPQVGTQTYAAWAHEYDRRKADEELKQLRDQAHKNEIERVRAEAEAKARAAQASTEKELSELRSMVASLTSTIREKAAAPAGPDPAFIELREQNKRLEERLEREKAEREQDRRDREMKEAIAKQAEEAKRDREAMDRKFEQMIASMNSNKNDPFVEMVKEMQRVSAEQIKEVSRNMKEAIDKISGGQLKPLEIIDLMQRSNSGIEAATNRLAGVYDKVIDTQQKVTENALAMQPQGSPVVDTIREGISGLQNFANKYVEATERNQRFAMGAQVQVAQAQAAAAQATSGVGLGGPAILVQQPGQPIVTPAPTPDPQLPAAQPASQPPSAPANKPARVERLWGRTDEEWFGTVALPEIIQLREGAKVFLEAMHHIATHGSGEIPENAIRPDQAAWGVLYAKMESVKTGLVIPALRDLLDTNQLPELISVLLPDTNQPYRDEMLAKLDEYMKKAAKGEEIPAPSEQPDLDANDDDDDDDDDAPENVDGKVGGERAANGAVQPLPAKPAKAQPAARRA